MNFAPARAWLITNLAPRRLATGYSAIAAADVVVAVDGGYLRCRELGLEPAVLIGDFDSLTAEVLATLPPSCLKIRYPARKNETDTQLALRFCAERGWRELVICNSLSGRFDHSLALVQNLLEARKLNLDASVVGENQIVFLLREENLWDYPPGTLISLVSLSETAEFADSAGLEYSLQGLTLYDWDSRGISNVVSAPRQSIAMKSGTVLAVVTLN